MRARCSELALLGCDALDDLGEQSGDTRGGFLASLDDFLVGQRRFGDAGGEVRHERQAQNLHTGLSGGDGLQRGGHTNEVCAEDARHLDLGRSLVMGATELGVDTLGQFGIDLTGHAPQARGVEVGEVHEVRALDGGGGGEIDVVADEHHLAGTPLRVEATAAVGQYDGLRAGCCRGSHAVGDGTHALALIEVGA